MTSVSATGMTVPDDQRVGQVDDASRGADQRAERLRGDVIRHIVDESDCRTLRQHSHRGHGRLQRDLDRPVAGPGGRFVPGPATGPGVVVHCYSFHTIIRGPVGDLPSWIGAVRRTRGRPPCRSLSGAIAPPYVSQPLAESLRRCRCAHAHVCLFLVTRRRARDGSVRELRSTDTIPRSRPRAPPHEMARGWCGVRGQGGVATRRAVPLSPFANARTRLRAPDLPPRYPHRPHRPHRPRSAGGAWLTAPTGRHQGTLRRPRRPATAAGTHHPPRPYAPPYGHASARAAPGDAPRHTGRRGHGTQRRPEPPTWDQATRARRARRSPMGAPSCLMRHSVAP